MPNIRVSEETLAMLRRVQGIFRAVDKMGEAPTYDEIIRTLLQPIIDLWEGRLEVVELPVVSWEDFANYVNRGLQARMDTHKEARHTPRPSS